MVSDILAQPDGLQEDLSTVGPDSTFTRPEAGNGLCIVHAQSPLD